MTAEEKFLKQWFQISDEEDIDTELMFVRVTQWKEVIKQYAKHHAGLAFDAGIDWYEEEIERAAHQENKHPNKEQYLKETFK